MRYVFSRIIKAGTCKVNDSGYCLNFIITDGRIRNRVGDLYNNQTPAAQNSGLSSKAKCLSENFSLQKGFQTGIGLCVAACAFRRF